MKEIHAIEYISTKSVCEKLKIQPSTLRKYASMLDEKAKSEFYFTRDDSNNRVYTKEDIAVLQRIIELKNRPGYTLEAAINEVVGLSYNSDTQGAIAVKEENDTYLKALHSFVAQQNKYFEDYQSLLQKKDEQIDRLESLVSSLIENNTNDMSVSSEDSTTNFEEPKDLKKMSSEEAMTINTPKKKKWWNFK
ncbi:MerR family transcriptional regulator [Carnobacterium inhibens]|uniref:helix-turn-helix domain-containing protein n=1 Tax=Carnobacterium inhibens TaxID=147709 RepID=UPI00203A456E|nr:MerR family transcriptional regulator [Carnobacterium inhibens]MCM3513571.1 helix-turn-helix domain-containing protein [Carnobacterium inhibens]